MKRSNKKLRGDRVDGILKMCGLKNRSHPGSFYLNKREIIHLEAYLKIQKKK